MQPCYYLKDYLYSNKKGHLPSCYSADIVVTTTDTFSYTHMYIFKYTQTLQHFNCSEEALTNRLSRILPCFYRSWRLMATAASEERGDHIFQLTLQSNSLLILRVSSTCKKTTIPALTFINKSSAQPLYLPRHCWLCGRYLLIA